MTYAIIATLGPASSTPETWQSMLQAGATGFRLNTSHLSLEALAAWLEQLATFQARQSQPLPVTLDLQGSKWRLGGIEARSLAEGERVELVPGLDTAAADTLPVPHTDFFRAAERSGGLVSLNDDKVRLMIEDIRPECIRARVVQGGPLAAHKGITLPDSDYRSEALSEKDRAIFRLAQPLGWVRYAISYVRDAAEMATYRALADQTLGRAGYLIAKLERGPAMHAAAQMVTSADELWVCRGDLGAELGLAEMARAVAAVNRQVRAIAAPVMMAGQVLEHMTGSPTPTRSEVCYLYDTLECGYQGFVLSDEAAIGRYPVEACRAAAIFKA